MKKLITGAMVVMALLSVAGVSGQVPPPPRAGAPPPPPGAPAPGPLGAQITSLVKAGSTVMVNGTLDYPPFGSKEIRMVSLSIKDQTVYDSPPATPATPPADNFVSGNGKVVGTQIDREGRMNGLLLDNRTVLRIPPGTAGQLTGLAKDGSQVGYSGMQKAPGAGEVAASDLKIVHCNTISINGQQFLVR